MSSKRRAELPQRRAVREAVFERDGHRCRVALEVPDAGPCFGRLTFAHRKREGQGGEYSQANGVAACSSHNERMESDADFAARCEALGFIIRSWQPNPDEPL